MTRRSDWRCLTACNDAGSDADMAATSGQQTLVVTERRSIFPPIVADNAEHRGRAHRRHGERPATAGDPAPPPPVPDMAPLEARPVPWTPAQPTTSPLSSVPSTPGTFLPVPPLTPLTQSRAPSPPAPERTTPRRRSKDARGSSKTPRGASPSPGPTRRSGTVGLRSKLSNAEIGEIQRNLPEDYRRYKDRMHARGAIAEDAAPQSVRHFAKPTRGCDRDGRGGGRRGCRISAEGPADGGADLLCVLVLPTPARRLPRRSHTLGDPALSPQGGGMVCTSLHLAGVPICRRMPGAHIRRPRPLPQAHHLLRMAPITLTTTAPLAPVFGQPGIERRVRRRRRIVGGDLAAGHWARRSPASFATLVAVIAGKSGHHLRSSPLLRQSSRGSRRTAQKEGQSEASPVALCVAVGCSLSLLVGRRRRCFCPGVAAVLLWLEEPRRRRRTGTGVALVPTTTPSNGTVSEFLKLVAEAGGTAHLATFARLGVVNTPAVRESFPVLLNHGVPEAVLVAILAPVPPVRPEAPVTQTRIDVPERRATARASMTAALYRGHGSQPPRRHSGGDRLEPAGPIHSPGHAVPREDADGARRPRQLPALPPRRPEAAADRRRPEDWGLQVGGPLFRRRHVAPRGTSPSSADLRRAAKSITKAALRGLPGSRLRQAFDLADLATLVERDVVAGSFDMNILPHAVDIVVLATWFMLREIEIAGARVKDIEVTPAAVSLDIPLHKTAQGGQQELTRRSFRCVCSTAAQPLCPRCSADRHARRLDRAEPGAYLFPGAGGQQRTKLETAELFNMVLSAAGLQTVHTDTAGHKRFIFGGHAARVAGATFLALRGVPVTIIQLIGRWSSTAVERYTQQAPLAVAPGIPAQALAAGGNQTNAVLDPSPAQLGNAQAAAAAAICDAAPAGQEGAAAPGEPQVAPGGVPAVDFSAELPAIEFIPAPLSAEQAIAPTDQSTQYIMNCRTKLLHKPAADENTTERAEWQAWGRRRGWHGISSASPEPSSPGRWTERRYRSPTTTHRALGTAATSSRTRLRTSPQRSDTSTPRPSASSCSPRRRRARTSPESVIAKDTPGTGATFSTSRRNSWIGSAANWPHAASASSWRTSK